MHSNELEKQQSIDLMSEEQNEIEKLGRVFKLISSVSDWFFSHPPDWFRTLQIKTQYKMQN